MEKKVLVTGASGFIGSFLVEGGLECGMRVWAGVRKSSSRKYLQDSRISFAELDFTDSGRLEEQLKQHKLEHGGWDYIIHCAGVTKCRDKANFEIGNYWVTRHFIETLMRLEMLPEQFIYISSLSIFGPIREKDYSPICEQDTPRPNTAYGVSKLHSEEYLQKLKDFPYVIFRPTGVYGPREKDYFLMVESISRHVDFAAGFRRQDITFVYVKDLVQAVYRAIDKKVVRRAYFVSDGYVYNSRTFSDLIQKELGNPWLIRFTCPLALLKVISFFAENIARLFHKSSTLNLDKYKIMKQRNWQCDITPLEKELGYRAEYPLERGVKEIIAWYKKGEMAIKLFERVDSGRGLFAVETISLIYNALTSLLILLLFPRMDHPGMMLLERLGIVILTFVLIFLYQAFPCRLTAFVRMAVQMSLLAYWYPDTFEFNRLFPNLDYLFAHAEQILFGCQPAVEFSKLCPSIWFSEPFNMGYFFYYPMILVVVVYYFLNRFEWFEKICFVLVTSFFIYYFVYIMLPVAGPQFYFPAIGMDKVNACIFPAIGDYFNTNDYLIPGPGFEHGLFYQLVEASQEVGERPTAAFPSSHVGISTIVMIMAWRVNKKLAYVLAPFYILLCCATVYIQAHYLIDAIVGFVSAFFVYQLATLMYKRWFISPVFKLMG